MMLVLLRPDLLMREFPAPKVVAVHPLAWLWEPIEEDPGFEKRRMFGIEAIYLDGKITLCFAAKKEPWRGLLVCLEREHHEALLQDFPDLSPHPVLPKWLYLSEDTDHFEKIAPQLIALAKKRDPRIGVAPKPKKRRKKSQK